MPQPLVITIILNTNRRSDTLECLASLQKQDYINHRVIVLDNASTDGSVDAVRQQFPEVSVVSLTENHGYAGNNNVGIELAMQRGADWVFVLNEDTTLDPGCLTALVAQGESDENVGIVGPIVYHHNEPTVIQSAGGEMNRRLQAWHRGQNEMDTGQYGEPREADWVSGCAILVKRQVIEQIGMLDARFFYYWEETEWCLRARRKGWQIKIASAGKLWHKGVQRNYQPKPSVTYYSTRNRLMMLQKHRVSSGVWLSTWRELGRTLASWTVKPKWRSQRGHRDAMWRGIVDFFAQRHGRGRPM
jgi:GT2 family glycosyltransferase